MIPFMDYIVNAFGSSTNWNRDNSYSSLTATSDSILSFKTPSTISLNVSSLGTPNFASSYTLSTLGQIDGSVSYLYSNVHLGHIASQTPSIPLRHLTRGYRDVKLPVLPEGEAIKELAQVNGRKPTLLHATLALPPPSTVNALYARRINPETLLSVSLHSKSTVGIPALNPGQSPAAVLAHVQHDRGIYSVEALGSTDSAILGARGLWNFGLSPPQPAPLPARSTNPEDDSPGFPPSPASSIDILAAYHVRLSSKPSLLSAGAEFYYSPFSHVIGLSTGLRFTTLSPINPVTTSPRTSSPTAKPLAGTSATLSSALLAPANQSHSSFPYTMTLTLTPLTGSLASTYSVKPTPNLALSSRFDFNVYSWESQYVVGAEIWRRRRHSSSLPHTSSARTTSSNVTSTSDEDPLSWIRAKTIDWFSEDEKRLKDERLEREEENVLKVRVDDGWNIRALWTGRVKSLLVSAGVSVSPVKSGGMRMMGVGEDGNGGLGRAKRWTGTIGVEVAYST